MYKLFLITSRSFTSLLLVLSFLFPAPIFSQHPVAEWLNGFRSSADFMPVTLLTLNNDRSDLEQTVSNATILSPDADALDELLHTAPSTITFSIPVRDGSVMHLELAKVEILASDFSVGINGDFAQENFPYHRSVHYRGIIQGNPASVAAISVTSSGVSGMVADENGTRQLGLLEDGSLNYIFYKTTDLKAVSPNSCFADDIALTGENETGITADDRGIGCKTVPIYFECDYKLYTDKGSSVANVTNYVTSLFNQIATLYANENVGVSIAQIKVWSSPDPYMAQSNIGNLLNSFRQTLGTNFNGNLAHFLTTRSLGGGIAYVDVICFKQYAFGVSCINTTFQNVPTYSWSAEVVTHELGHNLGSWHTQSCSWPNGALDNCVNPEGSCAPGPPPVNGGTIMSYCHLTGYGINFNNGFGAVPGAKIRDKVLNSTCLTQSGAAPTNLTSTNITGSTVTLNWGAVAGSTNYTVQYKTSSSGVWITAGTTTASVYNLSNLINNTAYNWQVKTDCSSYSTSANFSTGTGTGGGGSTACNTPASLVASSITTFSATLSWTQVAGAASYTVQYKTASASIWLTAGTTSSSFYNLASLSSATTYQWKVKANCSAYSAAMSFATSSSGGGGGSTCNAPATLTNNQVYTTSASISWSPVAGATSYSIQLKLANSTNYITLGTVPVTAVTMNGLQSSTAYHWRIKANCSFYSTSKLLTTPASLSGESGSATIDLPTILVEEVPLFDIYPNPANDFIFLKHAAPLTVKTSIVITSATGNRVLEEVLDADALGTDVSGLPPGVYFLSIVQAEKRLMTRKVVIVR